MTDNPRRFRKKESLWIKIDGSWREIGVESIKSISGRLAIKVKGLNSLDEVKRLTNEYIYVRSSLLEEQPDGVFYYFDLADCLIYDMKGAYVGKVVDIESYPSSDVLIVEHEDGRRNLFPLIKRFLKEVDLTKKKIIIDPPEGMFS
jgi:16S rRNA processing protein RimM